VARLDIGASVIKVLCDKGFAFHGRESPEIYCQQNGNFSFQVIGSDIELLECTTGN